MEAVASKVLTVGQLGHNRVVRIPTDWLKDRLPRGDPVRVTLLADGRIMMEAVQ